MDSNHRIRNQILRALKKKKMSFWELINYQDSHIVEFVQHLKELMEQGLIKNEDGYFSLAKDVPLEEKKPVLCDRCNIGVEIKGYFKNILAKFLDVTKNRPLPTSDFDQGFVRPRDTIARLAFIYERGDLEGQEIFILGDDDLLSVAIGLTGMAKRVRVVEIDDRITTFIRNFCKEYGIKNIDVREYNVLEEIPEEDRRKYDVFVTDPVETKKGLKLFVGRCIEALKGEGSAGYIGLTHREASLKKWYDFQEFLIEAGFVITDILRDFSIYPERENRWDDFYKTYKIMKEIKLPMPDTDWYKSCFVRFEAIKDPVLPEFHPPKDLKELYFDEESWATPLPSYMKDET